MSRAIDETGNRYGRLLVLERSDGIDGRAAWLCECDCGNHVIVKGKELRNGHTRSCGCLIHDITVNRNTKHGDATRSSRTRLYGIWLNMIARCNNPGRAQYKNYGGRGISVCDEWQKSYESFKNWAMQSGYCDDFTIDRMDVDGLYCPDNCRWVNRKTQNNNKRNNIVVEFRGERHSISEWSQITNIKYSTLYMRLVHYGWTPERALQIKK